MLAVLLGLSSACLDPMRPEDVPIADLQVTIGSAAGAVDTIQVRETTRVNARAYSPEGYDIGLSTFSYLSSDTTVAVVDRFGVVQGISPGEAAITVEARGVRRTVRVVVVPSTIAYTIPVGGSPTAIAFSSDFTRAYASVGESLVVIDALGFFRVANVPLGLSSHDLAAAGSRLYLTHPEADFVTVISTGTNELEKRLHLGYGARGAVAHGARAFIAVGAARHVVVLTDGQTSATFPVDGEPRELAISADGARLFVSVRGATGWHIAVIGTQQGATLGRLDVPAEPTALAATADGRRFFVLLGAEHRVLAFAAGEGGYHPAGDVQTGAGAGGIAVRPVGPPLVIVSGEPTIIFHAESLQRLDLVSQAGTGAVIVRPDGFFAFIAAPATSAINVIRM